MKKSFDLRLYLVTDKPENYRTTLLEGVEEAVAAGVTLVQYRADSGSKRELYDTARELQKILRKYAVPLIINDHLDLALAVEADGAHIGQNDLPTTIARKILGNERILGVSITTENDFAKTDLSVVDYVGIGPIFTTCSKRNAPTAIGVEKFATLRAMTPLPAVGIGGINGERAPQILAAGSNGIAVVSALSQTENITTATQEFLRRIKHKA